MLRNITADLYQIGECVDGEHGHEAVRVYVLMNNGRPILIDCGSHLHRAEVMKELENLLTGNTPEYIFLTHSELPHSGNLHKIVSKWPDIKVIVSNIMLAYIEIAPVLPLDQIIPVTAGTTLELAGRTLQFVDALLKDQPGSQWIYDPTTGTLFTGDGFGYYHPAGACDVFSDEREDGIPAEYFREFHRTAFRFLRWVIPQRLNDDLDKAFQQLDVKVVAPSHGNAIRGDIAIHLERLKETITNVCMDYRNGGN